MTTYKELFGKYVQNMATDPTSTDAEGQIWYNTTSGTFKTALGSYGVWSSGENLNIAQASGGSAGISTAALLFGGNTPPTTPIYTGVTQSYDGSVWTTKTSMNRGTYTLAGFGTQTAAIGAGG
jgi:hypothetical protein